MTPSQLASANIRAQMGRRKISRADLARALDVTDMWLFRRLNDQVPMSIDDLVRFADVLNVPVESLMDAKADS